MMNGIHKQPAISTKHSSPRENEISSRTSSTLAFCDGLRAWFALLVLWNHFAGLADLPGTQFREFRQFRGLAHGVGMPGFFVLSNFLLSYRLTSELIQINQNATLKITQMKANAKCLLRFGIRRLLRIYPLFWIAALAYSFVPGFKLGGMTEVWFKDRWCFWTLTCGCDFTLFWSLAVEVKSYLLIPIVCLAAAVMAKEFVLLYIFCHSAFIMIAHYKFGPMNVKATEWFTPWASVCLAGSLVGVIRAYRGKQLLVFGSPSVRIWRTLVGGINVLLFIGIHLAVSEKYGFSIPGHPEWNNFSIECSVYPGYAIALVFLIATLNDASMENYISRFFSMPCFRFMGNVSYSVYLWHLPVIINISSLVPGDVIYQLEGMLIVTILAVAAASISYSTIERASLRLAACLTNRLMLK